MKLSDDFGEDFPLTAKVIEAKTRQAEATVRGVISLGILAFSALAIVVGAVLGLEDGSFNELNSVWVTAAPLVGGVVGHYIGRKNE